MNNKNRIKLASLVIFIISFCLLILVNASELRTTSVCDINSMTIDSWVKIVGYVNKISYSKDGKTAILSIIWKDCSTKAVMFNINKKFDVKGFAMLIGKVNSNKDYRKENKGSNKEIIISKIYKLS